MFDIKREIDERLKHKKRNRLEEYYNKYREDFDAFDKMTLANLDGGTNGPNANFHVSHLGELLDRFDETIATMCESGEYSTNALGYLPNIAHAVITTTYGDNPASIIANNQLLNEQRGMVFYRTVRANTVKGNIAAANTEILKHGATQTTLQNYAGNNITSVTLGTGDGSTVTFTGTLATKPVRTQTFRVTIQDDATVYGRDVDGDGIIQGVGLDGTIAYDTGVFSVTVNTAVANTKKVYANYHLDVEMASSVPAIEPYHAHKDVEAIPYGLNTRIGLFEKLTLAKRFNQDANALAARDLIDQIQAEICGALILSLDANYTTTNEVSYNYAPDTSVSVYMHLMGFKRALAEADEAIVTNGKMGKVTVMVAGPNACSVLQSLGPEGGFKRYSSAGNTIGPHLFGTYDNIPIVRVPDTNILATNEILCLWKGVNAFEGGAYVATYLPLVSTGWLTTGQPLVQQQAAVTMQAVGTLNENFVTKITIPAA